MSDLEVTDPTTGQAGLLNLEAAPDDEPETEALPLDGWHRARGARMVDFAGYHMPIQYEGIMAEHLWVRAHAGLFDVSHMGQLLLSGEGVDEALEQLIPGDVKGLTVGQQRYSLLLNEAGGILDDLMVSRWPGGLYLVVNGATKWDDIAHLREQLPDEVTINHLDDRALLALQGPEAFTVLQRHVTGEWPLDALVFMRGGRSNWPASMPISVARAIRARTGSKSRSPPTPPNALRNCSAPSRR